MEKELSKLNYGIVLLSSDFRVIGLNDHARQVFGPALGEFGESLFHYHPRKSREKVRGLLQEMINSPLGGSRTMIIDILGKAIMNNLSQLTISSPVAQTCWAVTFVDVTAQTGAEKNPLSGMVEMKRIPVTESGSYRFIAIDDVLAIQSDGDYCRIFTAARSWYLHLNLKTILERYPCQALFRVHKSYVVNLRHIRKTIRSDSNQRMVVLDNGDIPPIPISRRKATDLKRVLELI
ncbi:MAG: LytTR family DNA-binding domain-containing protein [Desulfuromonadaceae bacterium]|nr:LytTR family DNA-binding domain-containing protein [Desulfuromonadaceae bacterium]MDD5105689.1 LytTR family DNA-binding domain-containing protein [Desulfuromonadaceae bacterium]